MSDIKINRKVDFLIKDDAGNPIAVLIGGDNMLERFKIAISEHYVEEVTEVEESKLLSGQNEFSEKYKFSVTMKCLDLEDEDEDVYDFELERITCYYPENY